MKNKRYQRGASLIEVMVALLILAVGLLGVLAMQARAVQLNQNAYLYSQAAILANDIMEAMRTSRSSASDYLVSYDAAVTSAGDCTTVGVDCSPSQIARWNLSEWKTNVASLLPGGEGAIELISSSSVISEYEIRVRFHIGFDENTDDPVTDQLIIRTSL